MATALHVLIIEDRLADVEQILRELRRAGFDPHWQRAETEVDSLAYLSPEPDIIFANDSLAQLSVLAALRLLRKRGMDIPFIVLTSTGSEDVALECMKQGATDYLFKDRLRRLGPAVAQALQQKQAEGRLRAALREKEMLLKEVHHRVKNNLQVICSLLLLQSQHVKDAQARQAFKESQNRIHSIALAHARLCRAEDLARIDMAEYLHSLAPQLVQPATAGADDVDLKVSAANVSLGIDTAIPCGLIITELVCHSLKHAFPPGQGKIRISLRSAAEDEYELTVTDNGVGSQASASMQNAQSLSLQLVSALAKQLAAAVEVGGGAETTFRFTFAEQKYKERVLTA